MLKHLLDEFAHHFLKDKKRTIMAEKKKAETIRKRSKVGVASVYQEYVKKAKKWRWRCSIRRKLIEKNRQRATFDTEDEAKAYAVEMSHLFEKRKLKKIEILDPIYNERFLLAQENIDRYNQREIQAEFSGIGDNLNIEKSVNISIEFLRALQKANKIKDGENYSISWAISIFSSAAEKAARRKMKKKLGITIDEFMREKKSSTGGKGRKKLSKDSIVEWQKFVVVHLKNWCGEDLIGEKEEMSFSRTKILGGIDGFRMKNGKPWSQTTKRKCAQKIKEFGAWLVRTGNTKGNPFVGLPEEYDFQKDHMKIAFYKNEEVKELFTLAMNDEKFSKLIPYLSLLFFAGLRPDSEVAKASEPLRRLSFSQIKWDEPWERTGGVNILIPTSAEIDGQIVRMTKTNYSRYADLVPAGQSFIKWWADKFHDGEIPENEKVFFSRRILDRLKKEWGHWQQDVSRHTFLSNAVVHYDSVEYWSQRAGHSEAVFKSYYQRPRNESQAKAYFDLRAEDIIIKSKD